MRKNKTSSFCSSIDQPDRLSAARLLCLCLCLVDEESLEEEELQVPGCNDEEAEGRRPPGDVLRVGQQQEVVCAPAHTAEVVVPEHVEDVVFHLVSRILQQTDSQHHHVT